MRKKKKGSPSSIIRIREVTSRSRFPTGCRKEGIRETLKRLFERETKRYFSPALLPEAEGGEGRGKRMKGFYGGVAPTLR